MFGKSNISQYYLINQQPKTESKNTNVPTCMDTVIVASTVTSFIGTIASAGALIIYISNPAATVASCLTLAGCCTSAVLSTKTLADRVNDIQEKQETKEKEIKKDTNESNKKMTSTKIDNTITYGTIEDEIENLSSVPYYMI